MPNSIAYVSVLIPCPADPHALRRVLSCLRIYRGAFVVRCAGCEARRPIPACKLCRLEHVRYWRRLHEAHPRLDARTLAKLKE